MKTKKHPRDFSDADTDAIIAALEDCSSLDHPSAARFQRLCRGARHIVLDGSKYAERTFTQCRYRLVFFWLPKLFFVSSLHPIRWH